MNTSLWQPRIAPAAAKGIAVAAASIMLGLLLAGCGSTAGANGTSAAAKPTPTCPPVIPTRAVTGTVKAISTGSFTVIGSNGATTTVNTSSTTTYSKQVQGSVTSIATGTAVAVTTDSSGVTALRIVVTGTGTGFGSGFRGFGGTPGPRRTPGARGTPGAGVNSACFRRGSGTPAPGFGSGRTRPGQFSGIRGTVTAVSSSQLVLADSTGQSYTVAVTSSTVVITTAKAQFSDLTVGATVIATGTSGSGGINARLVMIDLPASATAS